MAAVWGCKFHESSGPRLVQISGSAAEYPGGGPLYRCVLAVCDRYLPNIYTVNVRDILETTHTSMPVFIDGSTLFICT